MCGLVRISHVCAYPCLEEIVMIIVCACVVWLRYCFVFVELGDDWNASCVYLLQSVYYLRASDGMRVCLSQCVLGLRVCGCMFIAVFSDSTDRTVYMESDGLCVYMCLS